MNHVITVVIAAGMALAPAGPQAQTTQKKRNSFVWLTLFINRRRRREVFGALSIRAEATRQCAVTMPIPWTARTVRLTTRTDAPVAGMADKSAGSCSQAGIHLMSFAN